MVTFTVETVGVPGGTSVEVAVKPQVGGRATRSEVVLDPAGCNGVSECVALAAFELDAGAYFQRGNCDVSNVALSHGLGSWGSIPGSMLDIYGRLCDVELVRAVKPPTLEPALAGVAGDDIFVEVRTTQDRFVNESVRARGI